MNSITNDKNVLLGELLGILKKQNIRFLMKKTKDLEIGYSQIHYIILLNYKKVSTQQDMAEIIHVDKAAVARNLRNLEKEGYITITQNPENRRENKLQLTEKGKAIVPLITSIEQSWGKQTFKHLTEEEKTDLINKLRIMIETNEKMEE